MAAYASLLSLARTLHQILDLDRYNIPFDKEKIVSLLGKVNAIVDFLQDYSEKHGGAVDRLGNRVREAAYEAQDFMDSYLCFVSTTDVDSSSSEAMDEVSVDQDLNKALEKIDFIWEVAMEMQDLRGISYSSPVYHSSTVKVAAKSMVVGLDDDLNAIKERLYEDSAKLQIIPIVGMGGIGKTTLARKAYEDSLFAQYFDICAWIVVSAQYERREILLQLLRHLKDLDSEHWDESDAQLAKLMYQNLMGRRYLIVIDDIWSTKAWDDLKMIFPDDDRGSRVLLTTRLSEVAVYAGSSSIFHQLKFLNEDQSWKLLQERVFAQESCPLQLVEIGKKVARSCGGLPLTIVVVAGLLLSAGSMPKEESWENILENISSTEPTIALHCSKILCLSYDLLPLRLKPCFLYFAAYPEDFEIDVSNLIMLWVAEGFLRPGDQSKCFEDVGECYLEDLMNRSLILVGKKWPDGKLKTVGIHDLLREICITKAEEEGFLHHVSSKRSARPRKDAIEYPNRRLTIDCGQIFRTWPIQDSSARSVFIFSERNFELRLYQSFRRLRILDAPRVSLPSFSDVISTFVNLRYIAFTLNHISSHGGFPASISKLPNLQTIIAHVPCVSQNSSLQVPYEILQMPKLRHLIMNTTFCLSYPSNSEVIGESDLRTLDPVVNFIFTEKSIKILVNLKKLKVVFEKWFCTGYSFNLNNLFRLQNLVELQVFVRQWHKSSMIWNHAFPISLKKLALDGVPLPWENMNIIGSLPNLQVLHMMRIKVTEVSEWTPMEGQFLRLKYFRSSLDYLVKWEVEKEHFPILESLILRRVQIDEIPCGIGEIDSLQLIELQHCSESLVHSAQRIQEQQHENGNYGFQVRVNDSDENILLF